MRVIGAVDRNATGTTCNGARAARTVARRRRMVDAPCLFLVHRRLSSCRTFVDGALSAVFLSPAAATAFT